MGKLGDASDSFTKNFDDTMTYSECCKILDRSARNRLKEDKRSFDERFRSCISNDKDRLNKKQLKLLYEWIKGAPKKISNIFQEMIDDPDISIVLPECFFSLNERFGYLIFIKYLADQKIIKIPE